MSVMSLSNHCITTYHNHKVITNFHDFINVSVPNQMTTKGLEKAIRGEVNESQSKFLAGI
jgi:hypothetical protein